MSFTPNEEHYKQVVGMLQQAASPTPNPEVIKMVWSQFEEYSKRQDFNCYLAHAMGDGGLAENVREWATVVLKNGIKNNYKEGILPNIEYIQSQVMAGLGDSHKGVSNASANCVSMLSKNSSPAALGHLLTLLGNSLTTTNTLLLHGSVKAISHICEDCIEELIEGDAPKAGSMLPHLLAQFSHPDPLVREQCLWAAVHLCTGAHAVILIKDENQDELKLPPCIVQNLQPLLEGAMKLAMEGPSTQTAVCRFIVFIAETNVHLLVPHLKDTLEYILMIQEKYCTTNETVALEACDFWTVIVEEFYSHPLMQSLLPRIVSVLLKGMPYNEAEASGLLQDDDVNLPDREENIKPTWVKSSQKEMEDSEDEEDEEDDDDDAVGELDDTNWNLRRSSASTLDAFSLCYGMKEGVDNTMFIGLLLPEVARMLQPGNDWRVREAAILALGAVSQSCETALTPHIPQLIRGLTADSQGPIRDQHPLVRSITAWALGRFGSNVSDPALTNVILEALLALICDSSKKVVGTASSAMTDLLEVIPSERLTPHHTTAILTAVSQALQHTHVVNLQLLFNVIVSVAESIGNALNTPELIQLVMPPLSQRWEIVPDTDTRLQALMACMTAVATAVGPGFQPWVKGCFERAVRVIRQNSEARIASDYNGDEEFVVCALDLIGGLFDGVGSSIEPLVGADPILMQLLVANMRDPNVKVRQSTFALLGDMTKWCWPHVQPHVPAIIPLVAPSLDPSSINVCNNVTWALGEIAVKAGGNFRTLVGDDGPEKLINMLVPIMNLKGSSKYDMLLENCAVCIGRLALVAPDVIGAHMGEFVKPWCKHVKRVSMSLEQEHSFIGLARMIRVNPNGCFSSFAYICDALCSLEELTPSIRQEYTTILGGFKAHIGAGWAEYYNQFPPDLRRKLTERFGL
eukprot:TRINITY_DN4996_c0_g1_i1.p1 TRINITY_DN4996_c0_g1~~TRINITY_DN4996_c0_g1_i1.p1  ORF type:complete len:916 (+),score=299.22 TRINITY_DN4996_c0_g1_i1:61-2808(+)